MYSVPSRTGVGDNPILLDNIPYAQVLSCELKGHRCRRSGGKLDFLEASELPDWGFIGGSGREFKIQLRHGFGLDGASVLDGYCGGVDDLLLFSSLI
jgi:hypothetical protein